MPILGFKGVKLEEAPDGATPKCPYCEALLDKIWVKRKGLFGQSEILVCPYCRAFLAYGVWAH